ncbi:MAG: metallophosphatase family protein [Clostridiales bacterium]|nr:metallophosphatase family protein [Clostridiales bacterium]
MKTAVLSDTHNLLRPEVIEIIKDCDAVIHGGDICSLKTLENIKAVMNPGAPLFAVRGNCDGNLGEELPLKLEFELWGVRFFLVHNKKDIPRDVSIDIVIFGHSHKYYEEIKDNRLWLNPGSCGRRRFSLPVTMAVLNIEDGKFSAEKI